MSKMQKNEAPGVSGFSAKGISVVIGLAFGLWRLEFSHP
jgi:hypothetical protein